VAPQAGKGASTRRLTPSCAQWLYRRPIATGCRRTPDGDPLTDPPSGVQGKCTNTPLRDGVVLHAEASPRPTIVLDDYLRSVISVSVQRTKVSSFDPHLMSV
jgi:hypothetical protein